MSQYKTIQTEYKNLGSLLAALADLGYTKEQVQVAPNPKDATLTMYGYRNDLRPERCGLRIARQHIGPASNDVGFAWNGKAYAAIVSEFDMRANYPSALNIQRQAALKQRYAYHEIKRIAGTKGYSVRETKMPDGTIRLAVTHR